MFNSKGKGVNLRPLLKRGEAPGSIQHETSFFHLQAQVKATKAF